MGDCKYYWGFGVTYLDDDYSSLENQNQSKGDKYLHERIHFVQNFSTLYGFNKSLNVMRTLRNYVHCCREKGRLDELKKNLDFVDDAYSSPEGTDAEKTLVHLNEIVIDTNLFKETYPEYIEYFEDDVVIRYNGNKEYIFGGDAVCEGMAYQFEKYIYKNYCYEGYLPYDACDIVYEYIMGKRCENIPVMIALTYVSLMNKNPGMTFLSIVKNAKSMDIEFKTMSEVFDFQEKELRYPVNEAFSYLMKMIDELFPVDIVEAAIDPYFPKFSKELKYTNRWLKERYSLLIQNEVAYRESLIAFLEHENPIERFNYVMRLIQEYGEPIIIDQKGRLYPESSSSLVFLLAPWALSDIISRKSACPLQYICEQYDTNIDEFCKNSCWKREKVDCILKYYLLIMGLKDIDFDEI